MGPDPPLTSRPARFVRSLHLGIALLALWAAAVAVPPAVADDRLPQPKGPVVLSISGDIARTTDGTHALFDVAMLQALGMVTVRTRTPWTEGVSEFEGVLLRDVLRLVGASGETIHASALNDYMAEIPPADVAQHDVILALKKDGEYLTVRNMGPILVLYPFDSDPALQTEAIYTRSVWQLARLEVGTPIEDIAPASGGEPAAAPIEDIASAGAGEPEPAAVEAASEAPAEATITEPTVTEPAMTEAEADALIAAIAPASGDAGLAAAVPIEPELEPIAPEDEAADMVAAEPAEPASPEPAAAPTESQLSERFGNIPNGASLERNLLEAASGGTGSE